MTKYPYFKTVKKMSGNRAQAGNINT